MPVIAKKKHPKLPVKKHRPKVRWNYFTGSYTKRDMCMLKPERYRDWMTITELSQHTGKNFKYLLKLEKEGRIPTAARLQKGQLAWRLWSPEQVDEIIQILKTHRVGRPRKNALAWDKRKLAHAQGRLHVAEFDIEDLWE